MFRAFCAAFLFCLLTGGALAQQSWVRVEAQPSLRAAEERARAYSSAFPNVEGYRIGRTNWYAITLGPYPSPEAARSAILELRRENIIPRDSFVADSTGFAQRFWPIGAAGNTPSLQVPDVEAPVPDAEPETNAQLDETPQQARASERALTRTDREQLQTALQWFGYYTARIDGSFGRGTRASMARWQQDNAFEATGILTTKQRTALLDQYSRALAALGLEEVDNDKVGIAITMPAGLVEFAGYDYPFARFVEKDGSGVQVLLISQAGDEATLGGLYEIMQTLEIVPLEGERRKRADSFTLRGVGEDLQSFTFVQLARGYVKGFTLVYPPERAADMEQVISIMRESFRMTEGSLIATDTNEDAQAIDLLAGLELRQPKRARSGFYVDGGGRVLTVSDAVQSCERVTLDQAYEADVSITANGLALLTPKNRLVPLSFARFASNVGRLRSIVAVSGYSYGGQLGGPTLTYGTLEDVRGLGGDETVKRLLVSTLEGDIGGPVLDETGAVSGILMPKMVGGRALPEGTAFAVKSSEIVRFLSENGIQVAAARGDTLAAEELVTAAADITVLVSCW